jgi:membrane protease YdiL (CAAX protease family)
MEITSILRALASTVAAVIISLIFNKILPFKDPKQEIPQSNARADTFWAIGLCIFLLIIGTLLVSTYPSSEIQNASNIKDYYSIGYAVGQFVVFFLVMGLPLYFVLRIRKQGIDTIGFTKLNLTKSIALPFILLPTMAISSNYQGATVGQSIIKFMAFLPVGFFEEAVFRGYLQTRLINWIGKWWGLFLSSLMFSLWHLPYRLLVDRMSLGNAILDLLGMFFVSSLVLGWVFLLTKNIATPIILHTLMDWWEA